VYGMLAATTPLPLPPLGAVWGWTALGRVEQRSQPVSEGAGAPTLAACQGRGRIISLSVKGGGGGDGACYSAI
jgi:hypothetical protein